MSHAPFTARNFDDTHLKTIIHAAGLVASAALALAELTGASGRQLIDSLVLGIDVACRRGNTIYPDHYDRGWHITGSTGMFGAAAACSRLLQLDQHRTAMALGIAASQPIGVTIPGTNRSLTTPSVNRCEMLSRKPMRGPALR